MKSTMNDIMDITIDAAFHEFYKDKRVLITGHTGFKGSWICKLLSKYGAKVAGYSLEAEDKSLYKILNLEKSVRSFISDIRDYDSLESAVKEIQPEIIFHLAAQPIVRQGYVEPRYTFETNVMGTVNILECARNTTSVKSIVNVTTDKVYRNNEWVWPYREDEMLMGRDPYANSKSCSELVTYSYKSSFFNEKEVAVSTARAGNVIGGGDFAKDRIIPDCVRAAISGNDIVIRNPNSIRPYQHVLESLTAYLLIAMKQYEDFTYEGTYNVGPTEGDCLKTIDLAKMFVEQWGDGLQLKIQVDNGPHEDTLLRLDNSKIRNIIGWNPRWNPEMAIKKTIEWTKCWMNCGDVNDSIDKQIDEYMFSVETTE